MENNSMVVSSHKDGYEDMELPPGFRFHPSDEELITHYLSQKVFNTSFCARAIGEVDLNKCEPWDLPWKAKMGEKEWYFFCVRDRKYPTGLRTNRATDAGYWKATGKDREIYRGKTLVGMKKTLVFYKGRAPKGSKTNWVMHEFRLEGKLSVYNHPKAAKNEWVICRVFQKSSCGKKTHISGMMRQLPPLMDSSPNNSETRTNNNGGVPPHVPCFSNSMEDSNKSQGDMENSHNNYNNYVSVPQFPFSKTSSTAATTQQNPFAVPTQIQPNITNFQYPDSILMSEQSILRMLLENHGMNLKQSTKTEVSQDTDMSSGATNHDLLQLQTGFDDQEDPSSSVAPVELDYLWSYQI